MGEYVTGESEQLVHLSRIKINQDALINCSRDLIWSIDPALKLVTANNAFRERVQILTKDRLLEGESVLYKEFGDEVNKNWMAHYARALNGERFTIREELYNTAAGRMEYGQITFNPMYIADSEVFGVACYCKDITEDVYNLTALETAKDELQKIMDSSLDMICVIDENDRIVKISAASESILGYKPEELTGKIVFDFIHPDDEQRSRQIAATVMAGEDLTHVENRYIRKDGSIVPLIWSSRWVSKDRVRYGVARDATEKKKSEEALMASERIYRYLFEKNPFPIVLWNFETLRIVDCNEAACHKYGYTREEFLELTINDLRPAEDIPLIEDLVKTESAYSEHRKKTWRHKKKTVN